MALPPRPARLILLWLVFGTVIGVGIYAAFETIWAAIPAGFVLGHIPAAWIEHRRRTRVGPQSANDDRR